MLQIWCADRNPTTGNSLMSYNPSCQKTLADSTLLCRTATTILGAPLLTVSILAHARPSPHAPENLGTKAELRPSDLGHVQGIV